MKKISIQLFLLLLPAACFAPCKCKKGTIAKEDQPLIAALANMRTAQYPINLQFLNRWSSRAMSGDPVTDQELMTLFEAARWAPSAFNEQPWHFLYARTDDPYWNDFFQLLEPFNQQWVQKASILVLILSKNLYEKNGKPNNTHGFDTGASWAYLALQGFSMGLVVHAMSGFDYEKAREDLRIPECYTIQAMVAIGKRGNKDNLPDELRSKEFLSDRKKIEAMITHGPYLNC